MLTAIWLTIACTVDQYVGIVGLKNTNLEVGRPLKKLMALPR